MKVDLDGSGPLYGQLARALRQAVIQGHLAPGSRLPATRTLALALGVSRNTVLGAYELLCAEQVAVARQGSGTVVADVDASSAGDAARKSVVAQSQYAARLRTLRVNPLAALRGGRLNLHFAEPMFSQRLAKSWRRRVAAAAVRPSHRYPNPVGYRPLRDALSDYLARRRGVVCSAANIIIVTGVQQALTIVARAVLDVGDSVVLEDPHYPMAMHTLLAHGARISSVRTDANGIVVSEFPDGKVQLAYLTPSHQFPSGSVLSLERRIELLRMSASMGMWILEDDYDAEFHFAGTLPPPLRSLDTADRVLYVGSFSKTISPSLRLGYIVAPDGLLDDLVATKMLDDLGCPRIEQMALAGLLRSRQYEQHLHSAAAILRDRRRGVLDGMRRHAGELLEIDELPGGMHVVAWCRTLDYPAFEQFLALTGARGLKPHPIHPYYRQPPARPGLIVGYAALPEDQCDLAMGILGQSLREIASRRRG
jgi:GntR family transcriptional regulator / MocR family aminotransferase